MHVLQTLKTEMARMLNEASKYMYSRHRKQKWPEGLMDLLNTRTPDHEERNGQKA